MQRPFTSNQATLSKEDLLPLAGVGLVDGAGRWNGTGAPRSGARPLPCLISNNGINAVVEQEQKGWQRLCSNHKKVARALRENVKLMVARWGLEHVLFGVLTFDPQDHPFDDLTDYKVAQRNFKSLSTNSFGIFQAWARIMERHKSGVIHYHVLAVVAQDIRTHKNGVGPCDFEAMTRKVNPDYSSANLALREVWDYFGNNQNRGQAKAHGFGRNEWMPVKSTAEAVANYSGKYVAKHVGQRDERDKGARLVGYSQGAAPWSARFSLVGYWDPEQAGCSKLLETPWLFRGKLARLVTAMGFGPDDYGMAFKRMYGDGWCFWLGPVIESIRLPVYPTFRHALVDYPDLDFGKTGGRQEIWDAEADGGKGNWVRFDPVFGPGVSGGLGVDDMGLKREDREVVINGGRDAGRSLAAAVAIAWQLRTDRKPPGRGQGVPGSCGNEETGMEGPEGATWDPRASERVGGTWIERTCGND